MTGLSPLLLTPLAVALLYQRLVRHAFAVEAAKVTGVACTAAALGLEQPLTTALAVTAALDLAAVVSLTPAGIGVATAAAAAVLAARGADSAVAAAIVVHGIETAASISVGAVSAAWLGGRYSFGRASSLYPTP